MGVRDGKTEIGNIRLGSYGVGLYALIHRVLWEIRMQNAGRTEVWNKFNFVQFCCFNKPSIWKYKPKPEEKLQSDSQLGSTNIEMSAFSLEEKKIWSKR